MLIEDRKPKGDTKDSGYYRLLGHEPLANLIRKAQSCVIGNGNELENKVLQYSSASNKFNKQHLDEFNLDTSSAFIVQMKVPTPNSSQKKNVAVDCVAITNEEIFLIELKDGSNFDTKKSAGEVASLNKACSIVSSRDPRNRKCTPKIVFWNAQSLKEVSFKVKGADDMLMLGQEFCSTFGVDFNKINSERKQDAERNLQYFVEQLKQMKL
jgi:hypothetical protein